MKQERSVTELVWKKQTLHLISMLILHAKSLLKRRYQPQKTADLRISNFKLWVISCEFREEFYELEFKLKKLKLNLHISVENLLKIALKMVTCKNLMTTYGLHPYLVFNFYRFFNSHICLD